MSLPFPVDLDLRSIAEARSKASRAAEAFETYKSFSQGDVDRITKAAVDAGFREAERLALLAVEETGIGRADSKTLKNQFATRWFWRAVRNMPTCGVLSDNTQTGVLEIADPFGVVAAIIPTTNPTSTALFKALCCLKSRNAMVASPHPRAVRCIRESIRVVSEAATAAGAPADLLLAMEHVSLQGTQALMTHKQVSLILATGGKDLVRAAYSSGKPAFGVGPGNVPVYVDRTADAKAAARALVESQTFDNSVLCSSEQALVVDRPIAQAFEEALRSEGAFFTSEAETRLLEQLVVKDGLTNSAVVGLSAERLAELAGFPVPDGTKVLVCPYEGVGKAHPLSREKLCPILAFYVVDGHRAGCDLCLRILDQGGRGHTLGLHATDESIIRAFALEKPVNRIILNGPTSLGAVGFSTNLFPSMTLGCGAFGGNITSDNVGPQHLINVKRLARVRPGYRQTDLGAEEPSDTAGGAPQGHPAASAEAREISGGAPLLKGPLNPDHLNEIIEGALRRLKSVP
ncbi:MAG TPA: aldehyde dehydrogenase family protein [Planctomycetota bacterium]|mgnify:CR=1 FL=1|nr:aldehyde dehydrogenase family protein [Planctomycetota bacterium]